MVMIYTCWPLHVATDFQGGRRFAELEAKGVDLELQQRGPSVAIVAAGDEVNMEATITILLLFQHFFAGPNTSDTCSGAP
eukprot:g56810.t1